MLTRTRTIGAAVGAAALVLGASAVPAQAASADTATLFVLHAVPDTPVDVYVDGELTVDDFQPGDVAGPLELPGATYSVAITAADAADDSEPVIGPIDLELAAGDSYTAAAHLDPEGTPTATLFTNDTSEIAAGEGRLTVRHTAAAPAVDVLAGDDPVIEGLENPNEEVLNLPAGVVPASVTAAGETDALIGPADVDVAEGLNTIVYAWGSLEDDNLALATQVLDASGGAPSGVNGGTAGLAAESGPVSPLAVGGVLALLLLVGGAAVVGIRARRS